MGYGNMGTKFKLYCTKTVLNFGLKQEKFSFNLYLQSSMKFTGLDRNPMSVYVYLRKCSDPKRITANWDLHYASKLQTRQKNKDMGLNNS